MALITHLPHSNDGFDSILMVVDRLSKFTYFIPCNETIMADGSASFFMRYIVAYRGMPQKLITDHDLRFSSRFWQTLMTLLDCERAMSLSYHQETDG